MVDLLDAIAAEVGTARLSDLHQIAAAQERIPYALQRIPPGAHSLKAWQEAAQYILRQNDLTPETEHEAREMLEALSIKYGEVN